ncbi:MAG: Uncharacterised protein [Prochlorococcus marinus str. MIT 9313]|nr:MAG: Uncharacterised protein [Prochlorococcus marinus str. MIT 9313]
MMSLDLLHDKRDVRAGRECHHPEALREFFGNLEGLSTDRTCGAQHADGFHTVPAVEASLPLDGQTLASLS